jgi:hypothetical protein
VLWNGGEEPSKKNQLFGSCFNIQENRDWYRTSQVPEEGGEICMFEYGLSTPKIISNPSLSPKMQKY